MMSAKPDRKISTGLLDKIKSVQKGASNSQDVGRSPHFLLEPERDPIAQEYRESIEYLASRCRQIESQIKRHSGRNSISSLGPDLIKKCLSNVLLMSTALRVALAQTSERDMALHSSGSLFCPVRVQKKDSAILRLALPPLVASRMAGSYDLYGWVKQAVTEFLAQNPITVRPDEHLLMIYKRYELNPNMSLLDNDNFETKRVTNAVCEALAHDDNCFVLSFLYMTVHSSMRGVEATLIRQKDLTVFTDYLSETEPEDRDFLASVVTPQTAEKSPTFTEQ